MDDFFRRTKIVCTIGPASASKEGIRKLIIAGMDVARLNFSHGTHAQYKEIIRTIREVSEELKHYVAVLQDLSGPKIRVGTLRNGEMELRRGASVLLTVRDIVGDEQRIPITYRSLPEEIKPKDTILLADGSIELKVLNAEGEEIECEVVVGGMLGSHKGLNVPSETLKVPSMTEKDREDLEFGIQQGVDYVALSFVRSAEDVIELKRLIDSKGRHIPVIAKIEKHEALENIDAILQEVDGIMVARGDLGVEIPLERIPVVQKMLILKANSTRKLVITATQMLKSMVENPRPTRAEVTDVANAILDGTDALMLSEETAVGRYPAEAVRSMCRIAEWTERSMLEQAQRQGFTPSGPLHGNIKEAIGHAVSMMAGDLGASAIVTPTESGATARLVSKYRPPCPIIAISRNPGVLRQLCLCWGVLPMESAQMDSVDQLLEQARSAALGREFVKQGDVVIITAGLPIDAAGVTNMIKVEVLD